MSASSHNPNHSHDQAHDHSHGGNSRRLALAVTVTLSFAAVEAAVGWWAGSLALLGDAGHMVTDAGALMLAAIAARLALRPPSPQHSFGLGRLELLGGLINAGLMLAVVGALLVAAIGRLQQPQPVVGQAVLVVAALGLVINLGVAALLHGGRDNLNVRAALLHVLGDLLGSVAALISGLVIWLTGWTPIDPLLTLLIAALIGASSLKLLWQVIHALLDGVPPGLDLPEVGRALASLEGVASVHDLHIWPLSAQAVAVSAHLVVDEPQRWPQILRTAEALLRERFAIDHVTLQPELPAPAEDKLYPLR